MNSHNELIPSPALLKARQAALAAFAEELSLSPSAVERYRSVLLQWLQDGDGEPEKKPDYQKPGESGKAVIPNLLYLWVNEQGKYGWEKLVLKKPDSECSSIVIEAVFGEDANPCPPESGFEASLDLAEEHAKDVARTFECPIGCEGRLIVVTFKKWYCKNGSLMARVQVERLCGVI